MLQNLKPKTSFFGLVNQIILKFNKTKSKISAIHTINQIVLKLIGMKLVQQKHQNNKQLTAGKKK